MESVGISGKAEDISPETNAGLVIVPDFVSIFKYGNNQVFRTEVSFTLYSEEKLPIAFAATRAPPFPGLSYVLKLFRRIMGMELMWAKPETVDKVCEIVRKQLALPADSAVSGESKFASLGADSLDTVEIVMGLEEAFGISVEEEIVQTIATVQDAADLIESLIEKKD
ncbi:hypothetical protein IFM89_035587 [Coptis chinensis]|uniref:Acyl carrier protein n=1 Tax=Coptis chinensis TaxID=261450 RepID=A0A835LY46_9MAGN|nr:hypothetical protein IFM89_035587 [Coptis chinensis]